MRTVWAKIVVIMCAGVLWAAGIDIYTAPGTRAVSLGEAFSAVGSGAEAVFFNPAGIHTEKKFELSANYSLMYSVEGLSSYSAAVAFNTFLGAMGFGWNRLALSEIYSENLIIWRSATKVNPNLYLGAGIKFFVVSAPGYEQYGDTAFSPHDAALTGDVGLLWKVSPKLTLSSVGENLIEPEISLFSDSYEGDYIARRFTFGAAWSPQKFLTFSADVRTHRFSDFDINFGTEVRFFDAIALRSGFSDGRLSMGAGIFSQKWAFDLGFYSHRTLGNRYQFSLKLMF